MSLFLKSLFLFLVIALSPISPELGNTAPNQDESTSASVAVGETVKINQLGKLLTTSDRCNDKNTSDPSNNLSSTAVGAKKILASFFGDCDAAKNYYQPSSPESRSDNIVRKLPSSKKDLFDRSLDETSRDSYVSNHYFLKKILERKNNGNYPAPGCEKFDATKIPPVYGYGAKQISERNLLIDRSTAHLPADGIAEKTSPVRSIDCSGLATSALWAGGLRLEPGKDIDSHAIAQVGTLNLANQGCIQKVPMGPDFKLRPGDMINLPGHHVILVDAAGPDPLGLSPEKIHSNCNRVDESHFDFTYIHSGSYLSWGPMRAHASINLPTTERSPMGDAMLTGLVQMARELCSLKTKKSQPKVESTLQILRHKGTDPCKSGHPAELETNHCLENCRFNDGYPGERCE